MKFKVGDRVRFIKKTINHSAKVKLGKIYQIKYVDSGSYVPYKIENEEWFLEEELTLAEYTYEDLKKSPMGTKITFKDGRTLVKTCKEKFENCEDISWADELANFEDKYYGRIIKIEEPTYTTVYKAKLEILDEVEKRYLKGVIRPFRDKAEYKVKYMVLKSLCSDEAYISIKLENDIINLPVFEINTMYKNMEKDKEYTLEELGL